MQRQPCALRTGNCRKGQCARRRGRDEFRQTKKAPPWVGPVCGRSLHTWGGSTLSGQRLQELALLGVPMYEAHRSWQLPGQCSADIIM